MFKLSKNSLAFNGGHSDDLSFQTCKMLLGSPERYKSVEIIYAAESTFSEHCIFTLGGAHYRDVTLNGVKIEQNRVYEAHQNDVLKFKEAERGFRLYLIASPLEVSRIGLSRGRFEDCFTPVKDKIRVIKGPEFDYLSSIEEILDHPFKISANSDLSGLRLEGKKVSAVRYDISSSIVDDGLIQLTSNGPIILLRHRQVTGGYPRILCVIKTDLDFLAQYNIGAVVRFELIELSEAKELLLQRERQLKQLETVFLNKSTCIQQHGFK